MDQNRQIQKRFTMHTAEFYEKFTMRRQEQNWAKKKNIISITW